MILPIVSYGNSVLREKCVDIDASYPELDKLITDMWETLYPADGVGLAAPQVNHAIKLFIVDTKIMYSNYDDEDREEYFEPGDEGIIETFINAKITETSDDVWDYEEGCLSLPKINDYVERPWTIKIEYVNRNFEKQVRTFHGLTARVIQHEYDHTLGKVFTDHLKPLKRTMLKTKLKRVSEGKVNVKYKMKFTI